jgi:hypothetical protein
MWWNFFKLVFLGNLVNIPFTIYFSHFDKKLHPEKKGRTHNVISLMPFFFWISSWFYGTRSSQKFERKKERKKERKSHKSLCGPLVAKDQKPTSQNKSASSDALRITGWERERGKLEWAWKNKRPSVGLLLQSAASVTEWKSLLYFEEEEVGGFASTCHTAVVCSLDSIKLSVEYAEIKHLPWIIRL